MLAYDVNTPGNELETHQEKNINVRQAVLQHASAEVSRSTGQSTPCILAMLSPISIISSGTQFRARWRGPVADSTHPRM